MKKRKLLYSMGIILISLNLMAAKQQSFKIDDQTGQFTVRFSAVPNADNMNAALGLGPVELSSWGDFNCIIAFAEDGTLSMRNGDAYEADVSVAYEARKRYFFQVDVDVPAKTYTVRVSADGEEEIVIAQDYAFRETNFTGTLSYFSTRIETLDETHFVGVSGFQIGESSHTVEQDIFNTPIPEQTGDFFTKFVATPSHDNMNGLIGLSSMKVAAWGDYNCIIVFGAEGTILARNSDAYEAVNEVSYKAGKRYMFFVTGNTDSKTYSVLVSGPGGQIDTIAKDYGFRLSNATGDVLNNMAVHAVFNTAWSGLPATYLVVDGVENGVLNWDGANPVTNQMIPAETGTFTKTVAVTPSVDNGNYSMALSNKESTAWSDLNAIVGFGPEGKVVCRNGDAYEALEDYPYSGGQTYKVTMDVDVANDSYDVTIQGPSPQDDPVLIADDYVFRSAPVDEISYLVTKAQWDASGVPGGYLTLAEVGITENFAIAGTNNPPTMDDIADISLDEDADGVSVDLLNITDGDDGTQVVTVTAESLDPDIATVEAENISGNEWKLNITTVGKGKAEIIVTLQDDGGTENGGEDTKETSFNVSIGKIGKIVKVAKTDTPPTMDGFIDELNESWSEWHDVDAIQDNVNAGFAGQFSILYDDEYIYLAGKISDNTASAPADADHLYDHTEIHFHMSQTEAANGAYKEGTWQLRGQRTEDTESGFNLVDGRWGGNNIEVPWRINNLVEYTGFDYGFAENVTDWVFEVQVPIERLVLGVDDWDGENFRFDIFYVDNPGDANNMGFTKWNTEDGPKHLDMRSFGHAELMGESTGIEDIEAVKGSAFIYNDILTINKVEGEVKVYDITGKLVLTEMVHQNANIDVSNLVSGIYIVKGKELTAKVLK